MCLISTKELFLGKKQNKQKFICMLGAEIAWYNCQIYHDTADADFLIAMKTIESAENVDTVLMGEDTDLLVLLLYHAKCEHKQIFSMPEKSSKLRIWIIKESKEKLGTFRCKHILFLHAFRGADTTSCIYGFGKAALIKKIKSNNTQQMFLRQCNLLQQISKMLESKLCVYFTMEI